MNVIRDCHVFNSVRRLCTKPSTNGDIKPFVYNRNPRNLEKLRLARKPGGYHFDEHFVEYWHRLTLEKNKGGVTAKLIHNTGNVVVSASTMETGFTKFLDSKFDAKAHVVLAKVFAERCMQCGIITCESDVFYNPGTNAEKFLITLQEEGISLHEPDQFSMEKKWHVEREKRPWTVLE